MRRHVVVCLVLAAIVAAALGAAFGVYRLAGGGGLFDGEHEHDFGVVELDGPRTLEHRFVLTNRSGRTIEIQDIRHTCSCTIASYSPRRVEPGGTVRIDAKLSRTDDGVKAARISLICGDAGIEELRLTAAARQKRRVVVPAEYAPLEPGVVLRRKVHYLDYDTDAPPPAPRLEAPPGVRVSFSRWELFTPRRSEDGYPARWQGDLEIEQVAPSLPREAAVVIRVGDDQETLLPMMPADEAPPLGVLMPPPGSRPRR